MVDNSNNIITNQRIVPRQSQVTDRGSLLAQSLTYSRAGNYSGRARTANLLITNTPIPITPSNNTGIATNLSTSGRNSSSSNNTILKLYDLNGDKDIDDNEIIDVSLTKHFSDSIILQATQSNSNASLITELVRKVDLDLNGQISDVELAKALLADRRGEFPNLNSTVKNYLFDKNSNRAAIETELNRFDNLTGSASDTHADHIISDLELLTTLKTLKAANTVVSAATRAVLRTNPHYNKIEELLNNTNFASIDLESEKFSFLLNARKYGVEKVFADSELPGDDATNTAILKLVQNFDKDADGVISQREFVAGYIAIKKGNVAAVDTGQFNSLIGSTVSFSAAKAFVDSIAPNGTINEGSAVTSIVTNKTNTSVSESTRQLLLDVIQEASSNDQFKQIIGLLKPTPGMSVPELVAVTLAAKNNSTLLTLIDPLINTAYKNAISSIDQDHDGIISNNEVRNTLLYKNSHPTAYPGVSLEAILGTNPKYSAIKQLVDIFDTDHLVDNQYSDADIIKGLLKTNELKLTVKLDNDANNILNIALNNDTRLQTLSSIVNRFDKDSSGTISDEEYASVMVAIAKGSQAAIDPDLVTIINSLVPHAGIINNAIQEFANSWDQELTPQELMTKFRPLISGSGNNIDNTKLDTLSKVIGIIYPNADNIINLYLNFDVNHDDHFNDTEVIQGLLKYNSGQLAKVSNTALNGIIEEADHSEAIKYALSIIDTKGDGEISNAELVDALMQIKRRDFISDVKFNASIFNQILATNTNYTLVDRVMSTFNYTPGFKPTTLDLTASVLVQNNLSPKRVNDEDKDNFLKTIDMFGKPEVTQINTKIAELGATAFDAIGKIKPEVLLDKLILLSLGKLTSNTALTALLRTNSEYDSISRLFGKYSENKKLTENSLVKILVDANRNDPVRSAAEQATAITIKNYFIDLLKGNFSTSFLADYAATETSIISSATAARTAATAARTAATVAEEAARAAEAAAALTTATTAQRAAAAAARTAANTANTEAIAKEAAATAAEAQTATAQIRIRLKNELLDTKIINNTSIDTSITNYNRGVTVLDPERNGKMTSNEYFLHQYYFSDQFNNSTTTTYDSYDFNHDHIVDNKDKTIFDQITNYLKINS